MHKITFVIFLLCSVAFSQNHDAFSSLLVNYVSTDGWVNYEQLLKEKGKLVDYLSYLSENEPKQNATKEVKLAYYINLYNAATLFLVVDNYPVESIKDIGGLFQSPFKKKFISVGQETYSLDDIEKRILLPMGEPRVHFAINCASYSCPKILNEAYQDSTLEKQLEKVTKQFIRSSENKITPNSLQLSKIFQWYKSDFESSDQTLIDFLNRYSAVKIQPNAQISFASYNWDLNKQ